jgi:hypothetical protein
MLKKAIVALIFLAVYVLVVIGSQAVVFTVFSNAPFYEFAQFITLATSNALMIGLLLYHRQKSRGRWINEEAERWLARRSLREIAPTSSWRKKLRRGMLWVPTLVVLAVFLFLPESLGIASHLVWKASVDPYHLPIPPTWIIVVNGDHYMWVVAVRGMGRVGPTSYWRKEEPASEMTFSSYPTYYIPHQIGPPPDAKVVSRHDFPFGTEKLICLDVVRFAATRPDAPDPASAEVICSAAKKNLAATFSGWRTDLPSFYDVLQRVTERE